MIEDLLMYFIFICLSLSITIIILPYLIYKNRTIHHEKLNVNLFPNLNFLNQRKPYLKIYYLSIFCYAIIFSTLVYLIADFIKTNVIPVTLSISIFVLLLSVSLIAVTLIIKLVIPKKKSDEEKPKSIEKVVGDALQNPDPDLIKEIKDVESRLEFVKSSGNVNFPIVACNKKDNILTIEKVLSINDSLNRVNYIKPTSRALQNTIDQNLPDLEDIEEEKQIQEEIKNADPAYKFYNFLSVLPFLINFISLFVIFYQITVFSGDAAAYANILKLVFILGFRFISCFIALYNEVSYFDLKMKARDYTKAVIYNGIMTVFHFLFVFIGLYNRASVPDEIYIFSFVFIIYFIKTVICAYHIYAEDLKSDITMTDILKQFDRSQYVFSFYILMYLIFFLVSAVDGTVAAIVVLILLMLFSSFILGIFFVIEFIIYFFISRYVQKDQPSKAKIALLINFFTFLISNFVPALNGNALEYLSLYGSILSLIFALPPFVDQLLEIFRKRKWDYFGRKYRAEEKNIYAVTQILQDKIEAELVPLANPDNKENISKIISGKTQNLENIAEKTTQLLKPDLEQLKTAQKQLNGLKIESPCYEPRFYERALKSSIQIFTAAPVVIGLFVGFILLLSSYTPELFEYLYNNSPFGSLPTDGLSVYLRTLQVFEFSLEIVIISIIYFAIDNYIVNVALKAKVCTNVNYLNYGMALAFIINLIDFCYILNFSPCLMLVNGKLILTLIGLIYYIKGLLVNEEIAKAKTPKINSGLSYLQQMNMIRVFMAIMISMILFSERFLVPIGEDLYFHSMILNWWDNFTILIIALLNFLGTFTIILGIELLYFIVLTCYLNETKIQKIHRGRLGLLSFLTLFFFGEGVFGFIILYYVTRKDKLEDSLLKRFLKQQNDLGKRVSNLEEFRKKRIELNAESLTNRGNLSDPADLADRLDVPDLKNSVFKKGDLDGKFLESQKNLKNQTVSTILNVSADNIDNNSIQNSSIQKINSYFIPTPLLIGVFGDPVFGYAQSIESSKESEGSDSNTPNQVQNSSQNGLRKVLANELSKSSSLSTAESTASAESSNDTNNGLTEEIASAKKMVNESLEKKRIKKEKGVKGRILDGVQVLDAKLKTAKENLANLPENVGNFGTTLKENMKKKFNELEQNVKNKIHEKIEAFKQTELTIPVTLLIIISVLFIFALISEYQSIEAPYSYLVTPQVLMLTIGGIGLLINKKQLYTLLIVSLLPSFIMIITDLIHGNIIFLVLNCIVFVLGCIVFVKKEFPHWSVFLINAIVYLYLCFIIQILLIPDFFNTYFDSFGMFYTGLLIGSPIVMVIISYFKSTDMSSMFGNHAIKIAGIKLTEKSIEKSTKKSSNDVVVNKKIIIPTEDKNTTWLEKRIYNKFGINNVTLNMSYIVFFVSGLILSIINVTINHGNMTHFFMISHWVFIAAMTVLLFNNSTLSSILVSVFPPMTLLTIMTLSKLTLPNLFDGLYHGITIIIAVYVLIKKRDARWDHVFISGLMLTIIAYGIHQVMPVYISAIDEIVYLAIINAVVISVVVYLINRLDLQKAKREIEEKKVKVSNDVHQKIENTRIEDTSQKIQNTTDIIARVNRILAIQSDPMNQTESIEILQNAIENYKSLHEKLEKYDNIHPTELMKNFALWMRNKQILITEGAYNWLIQQPIYITLIKPMGLEKTLKIIPQSNFDGKLFSNLMKHFYQTPKVLEAAKALSSAAAVGCPNIILPDLSWLFLEDYAGYVKDGFAPYHFKFLILPFELPGINYINIYGAETAGESIQGLQKLITSIPLYKSRQLESETIYDQKKSEPIEKTTSEHINNEIEDSANVTDKKEQKVQKLLSLANSSISSQSSIPSESNVSSESSLSSESGESSITSSSERKSNNLIPDSIQNAIIDPTILRRLPHLYKGISISYIITQTVFILVTMAILYYFFEQIGIVPIVSLTLMSGYTIGETLIIFILAVGGCIAIGLIIHQILDKFGNLG